MFRKNRKHKNIGKKITTIILVVLIVLVAYLSYVFTGNSALIHSVEINSSALITKALNDAVAEVLHNQPAYDELVSIIRDNDMNIVMVQANSYEINTLSRSFAQTTENKIEELGIDGISVPIGTFSGINILVGRGPSIDVLVKPIGAVNCNFLTQFESAGINQTNHKIFLRISIDVGVVLPINTHTFSTEQDILLSESILIGKVPQVYLNYTKPTPLLNLTP